MKINLTRQEIVDGLVHPDRAVRSTLLGMISDERNVELIATKRAIEAVKKYGWKDAFVWDHQIASLSQDGETVEWLLDQIFDDSDHGPSDNTKSHLVGWFCKAPVELMEPHLERVAARSLTEEERAIAQRSADLMGSHPLSETDCAKRRLALQNSDVHECLNHIDEFIKATAFDDVFPHRGVKELALVIERLVACKPRIIDSVLHWIQFDFEEADADPEGFWRAGVGIVLAGKMRIDEAVPHFFKMFEYDWDWWHEGIENALLDIGTPTMISHVLSALPTLSEEAQGYASIPLENARIPGLDRDIAKLLLSGEVLEDHARINLATALARYANEDSLEIAQAVYDEDPKDPERQHLVQHFFAFHRIAGLDHPDLQRWQKATAKEQDMDNADVSKLLERFLKQSPEIAPEPLVGRNDPCPCSSGKKYKKCCLPKN